MVSAAFLRALCASVSKTQVVSVTNHLKIQSIHRQTATAKVFLTSNLHPLTSTRRSLAGPERKIKNETQTLAKKIPMLA